ncbi:unnamed protein product, partial [marine sediment metagenome]
EQEAQLAKERMELEERLTKMGIEAQQRQAFLDRWSQEREAELGRTQQQTQWETSRTTAAGIGGGGGGGAAPSYRFPSAPSLYDTGAAYGSTSRGGMAAIEPTGEPTAEFDVGQWFEPGGFLSETPTKGAGGYPIIPESWKGTTDVPKSEVKAGWLYRDGKKFAYIG